MVINPLDEHQQRTIGHDESAKRRSKSVTKLQGQRNCVFKPLSEGECLKEAASQFLSGWAIDPETITLVDIAARTALCERYLQPCGTTLNHYKARQTRQGRGAPVQTLKGVPVPFATGKDKGIEDNEFIRWVNAARH